MMRNTLILLTFYLSFMGTVMGQSNQKDLTMTYSKFINLDNFDGAENIEKIYVFNDSTLVFPVIKTEVMPKNGVLMETPNWVNNFKNLKELYLVGLFISVFDSNLTQLGNLEKLKFSIPKNTDIDKMVSDLEKFKMLKVVDISDSVIDIKQIQKLEKALPNVKIVNNSFFK